MTAHFSPNNQITCVNSQQCKSAKFEQGPVPCFNIIWNNSIFTDPLTSIFVALDLPYVNYTLYKCPGLTSGAIPIIAAESRCPAARQRHRHHSDHSGRAAL
uniref:Uncharacterized protein n=1 Tax=Cacopsylla melanoneura TaxID=428564 RepID=A0A8D8YNZ6_9HEMI